MINIFSKYATLISIVLFLGISSSVMAGEYESPWFLYESHGGGF